MKPTAVMAAIRAALSVVLRRNLMVVYLVWLELVLLRVFDEILRAVPPRTDPLYSIWNTDGKQKVKKCKKKRQMNGNALRLLRFGILRVFTMRYKCTM